MEDSRTVCSNLSLSSSPPTETSCDVRGTPHASHGFRAADDGRTGPATTQTVPRYPHHLNSMAITAAPQVLPGWRPSTQSRPHASFFTVPTELSAPGRPAGCYSSDKFLAPVVITGLTKRGATGNAMHSHLAPPARHRAAPFGGYGDFLCYETVDPNSGLVNPPPPACCASPLSSPSLPWTRSTRWLGPNPSKCLVLTRPTGATACDSPQAVQVRSGSYTGGTSMISQKKGSERVTAISNFRGPQVSWLALAGRCSEQIRCKYALVKCLKHQRSPRHRPSSPLHAWTSSVVHNPLAIGEGDRYYPATEVTARQIPKYA